MTRFWKLRLSTLAWGFGVSLVFTGSLVQSIGMWSVVVAGNSVLMWRYGRGGPSASLVRREADRLIAQREDLGLTSNGSLYGIIQLRNRIIAALDD